MAGEGDWLDPEWGIPSGLSGFFDSRTSKLAGSAGLSRGLDTMEMMKSLVQDQYEAKRPDDGISGVRTAIVVFAEYKQLTTIRDPVIEEIWSTIGDSAAMGKILVVYAAPAGGSCSMLPKPTDQNDMSSIYKFPRFYGIDSGEKVEDLVGRPCEVSYLDQDTLSFGLFHNMVKQTNPESPAPSTFLYRNASSIQGAKRAFHGAVTRPNTISYDTLGGLGAGFYRYAILDASTAYHKSVIVSTNNPYGERGGNRIKNNVELDKRKNGVTFAGFRGRKYTLERGAYSAYIGMLEQATKDGIPRPLLECKSGYRSSSHQRTLYEKALRNPRYRRLAREMGRTLESVVTDFVAPPGRSRHHSGRAIDMYLGHPISSKYISQMKATHAFAWLLENAQFFGFYNYHKEPWHWEFNPDARSRRVSDLTSLRTPTSD